VRITYTWYLDEEFLEIENVFESLVVHLIVKLFNCSCIMHSDFSFVLEGWVGTSRLLSVEKLQRSSQQS
jgi:hypothetical protein